MTKSKTCTACFLTKDETLFSRRDSDELGNPRYRNICKECINARTRQAQKQSRSVDRQATQDLDWKRNLWRVYKMTPTQWNEMFISQSEVCLYCFKPETKIYTATGATKRLSVDHDHKCCPGVKSCGKCVRGLLCYDCNFLLGKIETNLEVVKRMNNAHNFLED